jgi:hypothetical protein
MLLVKLKPMCKHVQKNDTVTPTSDNPTLGHTHIAATTPRDTERNICHCGTSEPIPRVQYTMCRK